MARKFNNCDGTNAATITTGNSGGLLGDAFDGIGGSSPAFDTSTSQDGSACVNILQANGSTSANYVAYNVSVGSGVDFYAKFFLRISGGPTSNIRIAALYDGAGAQIGGLRLNTSSQLASIDTANTVISTATSGLPFNTWVRVELRVRPGAGTGQIEFSYWTTADSESTATFTNNTGSLTIGTTAATFRLGVCQTITAFSSDKNFRFDGISIDTAGSAFFGPRAELLINNSSATPTLSAESWQMAETLLGTATAAPTISAETFQAVETLLAAANAPPALVAESYRVPVRNNTAEGQTSATTPSTANTGGGSGDAFTGVSGASGVITFDNGQAHTGSQSYKYSMAAGSTTNYLQWDLGSGTTEELFGRMYLWLDNLPSVSTRLIGFHDSGNTMSCNLTLIAAGTLRCRNAANTNIGTASGTLPTGQWIRIEWRHIPGAVAGEIEVRAWWTDPEGTGTPDWTSNNTGQALGADFFRARFGSATSVTHVTTDVERIDDIKFYDTIWIGPTAGTAYTESLALTATATPSFAAEVVGEETLLATAAAAPTLSAQTAIFPDLLAASAAATPTLSAQTAIFPDLLAAPATSAPTLSDEQYVAGAFHEWFNTSFELYGLSTVFNDQVGSHAAKASGGYGPIDGTWYLRDDNHNTTSSSTQRNLDSPSATGSARFHFRADGFPASGGYRVFVLRNTAGSQVLALDLRSSGALRVLVGSDGTVSANLPALTALSVYAVDVQWDVSGTTWSMTARIDGGTPVTVTRTGQVADTINKIGFTSSGTATIALDIDQFQYTNDSADYPLSDRAEFVAETLACTATATPKLASEQAVQIERVTVGAVATPTLSGESVTTVIGGPYVENLSATASVTGLVPSEVYVTAGTLDLFNTGFETAPLQDLFPDNLPITGSAIATTTPITGAKYLAASATSTKLVRTFHPSTETRYVAGRLRVRVATLPAADQVIFRVRSAPSNLTFYITSTGAIKVNLGGTSVTSTTGAPAGTARTIDFELDRNKTVPTLNWRVGAVDQTPINAGAGNVDLLDIYLGGEAYAVDYDDVQFTHIRGQYPLAFRDDTPTETLLVAATSQPSLPSEIAPTGYQEQLQLTASATAILVGEVVGGTVETLTVQARVFPRIDHQETSSGGAGGWAPAALWVGGGSMTISVDPSDTSKLVIGHDTSGFGRSSDGGKTWRMANSSIGNKMHLAVASLEHHPSNGDVYALTGTSTVGGLLKSTDSGQTWTVLTTPSGLYGAGNGPGDFPDNHHPRSVGKLIQIDPVNGYIYAGSYRSGLFRATLANPNSWTAIALTASRYYIRSLTFGEDSSGNPDYDVLYVGTSKIPTGSLSGRVQRITSPRGTPTVTELTGGPININAVQPYKTTILAGAHGGADEDLWSLTSAKTAGAGTSWTKVFTVPASGWVYSMANNQGDILVGVGGGTATFNPPIYRLRTTDNYATAGNVSTVSRPSTVGGRTDQLTSVGGHFHMFETDNTRILGGINFYTSDIATYGSTIVISTEGSWYSDDLGANWSPNDWGLLNIGGRRMRPDPILPNRVYMANTDRQLYGSRDRFNAEAIKMPPGGASMGTDVWFDTWSKTAAQMNTSGARCYCSTANRDANTNGEIWWTDDPFAGGWSKLGFEAVAGPRVTGIAVMKNGSGQTVVVGVCHDEGTTNAGAGIYRKVIGSGSGGSAGATVTLAAYGDLVANNEAQVASYLKSHYYDNKVGSGLVILGDNAYQDGSASDFASFFHPNYGAMLYDANGDQWIFPEPGSHDFGGYGNSGSSATTYPGTTGYDSYFNAHGIVISQNLPNSDIPYNGYFYDSGTVRGVPNPVPIRTPAGADSNWVFINLSTVKAVTTAHKDTDGLVVALANGSAQYAYLRAALQYCAANNLYAVVSGAHAYYSCIDTSHTPEPLVKPAWDLLASTGMMGRAVFLGGHHHNYQRFVAQDNNGNAVADNLGVRQFIVGTGGLSGGYTNTNTPANWAKLANGSNAYSAGISGLLELKLGSTGYDFRFINTASGTVFDSGTVTLAPITGGGGGTSAVTKVQAAGPNGLLQNSSRKSHSLDWKPGGHALWFFDGNSGVWRSKDYGATWTFILAATDSDTDSMGYVCCHPTNPSVVYVSTLTKMRKITNALAATGTGDATVVDITGTMDAPSAVTVSPDGKLVVSERATAAHSGRLWQATCDNEIATWARIDDAYYRDLCSFPADLSRASDGLYYQSMKDSGLGRTVGSGGGATVIEDNLSLAARGAGAGLAAEVYSPAGGGGTLIETLSVAISATPYLPKQRYRQNLGFGDTVGGGSINTLAANQQVAGRFTTPNKPGGVDIIAIRALLDNAGAAANVRGAVYDAGATNPTALRASSGPVAIAAAGASGVINKGQPASVATPAMGSRVVPFFIGNNSTSGFAVSKDAGRPTDAIIFNGGVYWAGNLLNWQKADATNGTDNKYLWRMDESTKDYDPNFNAKLDGRASGVCAGPGNTIFASGSFNNANGKARRGVAQLDAATGALSNPTIANACGSFSGECKAVKYDSGVIYVADSTSVTAMDVTVTPATQIWKRTFTGGDIRRLEIDPTTSRVIVCGLFTSPGTYITAIRMGDGTDATWANRTTAKDFTASGGDNFAAEYIIDSDIDIANDRLYVGSDGGGNAVVAYKLSTGTLLWMRACDGNCQTVAAIRDAGRVFAGHHGIVVQATLNKKGEPGATIPSIKGFICDKDGALITWNPKTDADGKGGSNGGTADPEDDGNFLGSWCSVAGNGWLYTGGDFTKQGGTVITRRMAAFDDSTGGGATGPSPAAWYEFPMTTVPRVTANTAIYLSVLNEKSTVRLYGTAGGSNVRTANNSYVSGPADPFPTATAGTYTPSMYAVIEWEETFVPAVVIVESVTAATTATLSLRTDLLFTAPETLALTVRAGTTGQGLGAESVSGVTGSYPEDLIVNATATPIIASAVELSEEILFVTIDAIPTLPNDVGDYLEIAKLTTKATPKLSKEVYTSPFAELLLCAIGTAFGLDEVFGSFGSDSTAAPDLAVVIPLYTPGVDISLYPVDDQVNLWPTGVQVAI